MNNRYRFLSCLALAAGLVLSSISSRAQSASGSIFGVAAGGGSFNYTITLTNTGSESLNSFWYGWTTSGNNLPSDPSSASNSLGWGNGLDGNSIMWVNSTGTALAQGQSATFYFVSTSSPSAITTSPSGESVAYVGGIDFSQGAAGDSTGAFSPLLVAAPSNSPPVITTQPLSQTVLTNTTVMFTVTASNATSYQWESNTIALPGATNDFLTLSNVVVADSATYQVVVSNATDAVTSSNAVLVVQTVAVPVITAQPQSTNALTNTTVTFSVTASNAAFYQWLSNSVDLLNQTNDTLILSNVIVSDSGSYQVIVSNVSGAVTSSNAVLVVGVPASITGQPAGLQVSAGTPVALQVEATGLPAPEYQWFLNGSKLSGQTNATLALEAATTNNEGAYSVIVSNVFGPQTSSNAVLTVEPLASVIKEKLTVTIDPPKSGIVSPNMNGRSLLVANTYAVTAVAAKGKAFANWTGIVQSDDPSLTFVMPDVSNATLTANFISSPFAGNGVAGAYTGLFWDANNLSNATSGYFSATVGNTGIIAGQVKIAGVTTTFSTTLRADGSASLELKRRNLSTLVLTLQLDLTGLEKLTGAVSDTSDSFNAQLTAYRAGFSGSNPAASYKNYYTWEMPGAAGNVPGGYSYGTATVAAAGTVRFTIFLSDGTTTTASGSLSTNGQAPLYASLYGGKGSLLSWLTFTNSSSLLSTNAAYWFKGVITSDPAPTYNPYRSLDSAAKDSYASGFTLTNLTLLMGAYTAEAKGINAFDASSVSVQLSGADLTSSISNVVTLNSSGSGASSATVAVSSSDKTGVFSGSFKDPATGKTTRLNGVVLRPLPAGYGFFTSGGLSGAVLIEPQ